jgi:Eukaryotic cytochrome b561
MDWLLSPWSGSPVAHLPPWAYWHARCMVLAWVVLMPLGVLVARFGKVLPGQDWPRVLDQRPWWHAHRGLQWAGVVAMVIGLGLVLVGGQGGQASLLAQAHAWAGWLVCALGVLQIASALARGSKGGPTDAQLRGDHYDMTAWRRGFERLHKGLGWLAVLLAVAVTLLGLRLVDGPRWMVLLLLVWWAGLATAFMLLQRAGRCIDTYQAIWGPDAAHPGNQRPPIGWGVRRPLG